MDLFKRSMDSVQKVRVPDGAENLSRESLGPRRWPSNGSSNLLTCPDQVYFVRLELFCDSLTGTKCFFQNHLFETYFFFLLLLVFLWLSFLIIVTGIIIATFLLLRLSLKNVIYCGCIVTQANHNHPRKP